MLLHFICAILYILDLRVSEKLCTIIIIIQGERREEIRKPACAVVAREEIAVVAREADAALAAKKVVAVHITRWVPPLLSCSGSYFFSMP